MCMAACDVVLGYLQRVFTIDLTWRATSGKYQAAGRGRHLTNYENR